MFGQELKKMGIATAYRYIEKNPKDAANACTSALFASNNYAGKPGRNVSVIHAADLPRWEESICLDRN